MRAHIVLALIFSVSFSSQSRAHDEACYRVGTWNLEHFGEGKKRDFPERPGKIDPRTTNDVRAIAEAIRDRMDLKIVTLQDINGVRGSNPPKSRELDLLLGELGSSFKFRLSKTGGANDVLPTSEKDILIGGDMNASWYNRYPGEFFEHWNQDGWVVMAKEKRPYPPTRVNGSQIDYLIATDGFDTKDGLVKEEIQDNEAVVHLGLAADGRFHYRDVYSDHFPVTTCINVVSDSD